MYEPVSIDITKREGAIVTFQLIMPGVIAEARVAINKGGLALGIVEFPGETGRYVMRLPDLLDAIDTLCPPAYCKECGPVETKNGVAKHVVRLTTGLYNWLVAKYGMGLTPLESPDQEIPDEKIFRHRREETLADMRLLTARVERDEKLVVLKA